MHDREDVIRAGSVATQRERALDCLNALASYGPRDPLGEGVEKELHRILCDTRVIGYACNDGTIGAFLWGALEAFLRARRMLASALQEVDDVVRSKRED